MRPLTTIGPTFGAASVANDTMVEQGGALTRLLAIPNIEAYDLGVMSAHGRTGVKR